MSRDIILGTTISAMGLGMYGLYYQWKMDRMNFLQAETEIKLSELEQICISIMLNSGFVKDLKEALYVMMRDEFGYDLSLRHSENETRGSLFRDHSDLMTYFTTLNKICTLYHKQNTAKMGKEDNQAFLQEWLELFPQNEAASEQNPNDKHADIILLFLLKRARETLLRVMERFFKNTGSLQEWKANHADFIIFLKEKKCINMTGQRDADFEKTLWIQRLVSHA